MPAPAGSDIPRDRPIRQVWVRPLLTVLVWSLAAAVVFRFFGAFKLLLLGVLGACAMASLLLPLVRKMPGPRGLAALIVGFGAVLATAAVVMLVGLLLAKPVQREWANWPQTRQQLDERIGRWAGWIGAEDAPNIDAILSEFGGWMIGSGGKLITGTAAVVVNVMIALAFVFIGSMYLLAEHPGRLTEPVLKLLPPRRRRAMRGVFGDLEPQLRWWMIGTLASMVVVGVVTGIGYRIVGLQFTIPLALLAALSEIVPTVGPIVAFLVALLFAAVQGTQQIVGVTIVYAIVQTLESYVILPLLMRQAVRIPPIVTLFSVVVWGKIFGAAGLFLAIPLDLVVWSLLDHFLLRRGEQNDAVALDSG